MSNVHINVSIEFTPNPNTLKFVIDRQIVDQGAQCFTNITETEYAPLAKKLLTVPGVKSILLGTNFVSITKNEDIDWDLLTEVIPKVLDEHFVSGEPVFESGWKEHGTEPQSEAEARIRHILDTEIRPILRRDGGDLTFHKFEDGKVYLTLQGACRSCPGAAATLKMGVEARLKEQVAEVKEVVQVW